MRRHATLALFFFLAALAHDALAQEAAPRPLDWSDLMAFRALERPVVSENAAALAYTARPDRGDPEVIVHVLGNQSGALEQTLRDTTSYRFMYADGVQLSRDGRYAALRRHEPVAVREATPEKKRQKPGLVVADLQRGGLASEWARVESFAFSGDGRFLARHHYDASEDSAAEADSTQADSADTRAADPFASTLLTLRHLETGAETDVSGATDYDFDETGRYLAVVTRDTSGAALHVFDLLQNGPAREVIATVPGGTFGKLTWTPKEAIAPALAFVRASLEDATDEEAEPEEDGALWLWEPGAGAREVVAQDAPPEGWHITARRGSPAFTEDGARLFFGIRPTDVGDDEEPDSAAVVAGYLDPETILEGREMDVWSWNDDRISPRQKLRYESAERAAYTAIYHRDGAAAGETLFLADPDLQRVGGLPENPRTMLARSAGAYGPDETYDGFFYDYLLVDQRSGARTLLARRLGSASARLSPDGRFALYYDEGDWHLHTVATGQMRVLTSGMAGFADEDWDYPAATPGYGSGGWVEDDEGRTIGALLYDKYDIWLAPLGGALGQGGLVNWTSERGRDTGRQFRLVREDPDRDAVTLGQRALLEGYHTRTKEDGFYRATVMGAPTQPQALLESAHRYRAVMHPERADRIVFTRERYDEFPDLWLADSDFAPRHRITRANPQMASLAWGEAQLVAWRGGRGDSLQGVVITPPGYDPARRYPVLVYFYRFFSQRLHEFNRPQINHRPSFPLYSSHDYVIFLPDVTFEIGAPGPSATKALVPGVEKLVELGIADPDRIGLHGHSWSGYQTAFVVTETDAFAAAVAGAPVTNMTSAYGGIRYGSGLARQFQYEKTQSRLGATLWEGGLDRYLDNSPLFTADQIETPLLMMFGDDDGAVPWTQGIELYLALRRLGKPAWLLQYRGEGHHLRAYANKLDYASRMLDFFDYYLKDAPAPEWVLEGEPYAGE